MQTEKKNYYLKESFPNHSIVAILVSVWWIISSPFALIQNCNNTLCDLMTTFSDFHSPSIYDSLFLAPYNWYIAMNGFTTNAPFTICSAHTVTFKITLYYFSFFIVFDMSIGRRIIMCSICTAFSMVFLFFSFLKFLTRCINRAIRFWMRSIEKCFVQIVNSITYKHIIKNPTTTINVDDKL